MERTVYERVGETVYCTVLDNGLTIYVDKKPDYQKSFAFFATNYGGMDMRFQLDGEEKVTPAGVAHFLEHKMFDTKDGNALQDLATNGASPNAFTSNAITGYYFESTEKFEENLKILLSFVSIPYFTQESVDKEQGIIGQEIQMIEDDPEWRVYMDLLEGLYVNNPIRVSVAGSRASIAEITADTLYDCHRAFYHPNNMVLCVAGDVDPEAVCRIAREILLPRDERQVARGDYAKGEPPQARTHRSERQMEVSMPLFQMGYKLAPGGKEDWLYRQTLGNLALEALCGSSSPLYARLYQEGLINDSFGSAFEEGPGYAFLSMGGESRDPQAVADAVAQEAGRLAAEGIDPDFWERLRKAGYGRQVRGLNSFEGVCVGMAEYHFAGANYFDFPACYDRLSMEDACDFLRTAVREELGCLAVVLPKEAQA